MDFLREKMREMNTKELKSFLERGGKDSIWAMEEILERIKEGKEIEKDILISSLKAKTLDSVKERGKKLKEEIANILVEKYFDEKTIEEILDCEQVTKKLKEIVAKKYLKFGGENKNILSQIVKTIESTEIINSVAQKLVRIDLSLDELEEIYYNTEGKLKREIFERILRTEINEANIGDFIDFIMSFEGPDAEKIFNKLKREGKIKELIDEENLRTLRLSDSEKISRWATKKLIKRLVEKERRLKERIKENQMRIKIAAKKKEWGLVKDLEDENERFWWDIEDIKKEVKKLKEEIKKENLLSYESKKLALASDFFSFYNGVIYGIKIFSFTLSLGIFSFRWITKN